MRGNGGLRVCPPVIGEAGSVPLDRSQEKQAAGPLARVPALPKGPAPWPDPAGPQASRVGLWERVVWGKAGIKYPTSASLCVRQRDSETGRDSETERAEKRSPGSVAGNALSLKFGPRSISVPFSRALALGSGCGSSLRSPERNSVGKNIRDISSSLNDS